MSAVDELAPGLHRWTARHPNWHPAGFGAEVASFALIAGGDLLLIDPLLPDGEADATLAALDALDQRARATHILITIGYHVRSSATLARRYGATVHGPPQAGKRLAAEGTRVRVLDPGGDPGPAGIVAHAIGRPRRGETPLWLPSHAAIAFGDALVTTPDGELRVWSQEPVDDDRAAFYRDRFAPSLQPLIDREPQRVLTTHGPPILADAVEALRRATTREPWYHRG
jgi:hypothetical protein